MTYKLGIIGYPISHSLSPVIHNAAFEDTGLIGGYEILETKPENLISTIKTLKTGAYSGFNVTIPHKVPITLFLTHFDEYANLSGSVNTVKIMEDKTLYGYNTDVYGFINSLPKNFDLNGARVAVIGTGGACRAICTACVTLGVEGIDLYSRNVIDSHQNADALRIRFPKIKINLMQSEMLASLRAYKLVVNTTPVGMKNFSQGNSPLTNEAIKSLDDEAIIYDVIYNPFKTELIKQAKANGKRCIGGLDMFIHQGAKAFEIWTGVKPNVDKMKIAALENLV